MNDPTTDRSAGNRVNLLGEAGTPVTGRLLRRPVVLSVVFPLVSWFFASWVGLLVGVVGVSAWWVLTRPVRAYWLGAAVCLILTPFAILAVGLPRTAVAGADYGTRHWLGADLVLAAVILAALAAITELWGLNVDRPGSAQATLLGRARRRIARRLAAIAEGPSPKPEIGEPEAEGQAGGSSPTT